MSTVGVQRAPRRSALAFLQHLGEMTLAMYVGMFAFGAVLGVVAGFAGSSLESVRVSNAALFMLGMGSAMSVTMVAWMRRRHHGRRDCVEMTGAMFVPVFVVISCYWVGALSASSVCPVACTLMLPAMAAAMLVRLDVYTGRRT